MHPDQWPRRKDANTRRDFLKHSGAAALAGGLAAGVNLSAVAHAAGSDVLKVGLVGCGGRGTGAAADALQADANVRLTAMADVFEDRLRASLSALRRKEDLADKIDVPPERQFVGFDAYKDLLASGVDVVLLCTPPHFRPLHLAAAVEARKHVFAEKPIAVDAPGVRSVLETCQRAEQYGLSVVSGLCLRYDQGFQETIQRLHDGAIGPIHTMLANDYRGPIWLHERQSDWTDMHYQMRNWYYYTWLSGDFNVEQHVHFLDVCAWALGGYPARAVGMGGRAQRTGAEFGHIYDHFSVVYEYENGARIFSNCRQQKNCYNNMSAQAVGARGTAEISEKRLEILSEKSGTWRFTKKLKSMYQVEHDELFGSIRKGQPINNGEYMSKSTLLAIMGRMAAYTGAQITWQQALASQENLSPSKYEWGPIDFPPVAVPGVTRFS